MTEAAVLRMVVSLAFIVILILAGAWVMRRAGWLRPGAGQALKVMGSQSLGARSSIAVVQVEDARLVLGITPQQITLLHTMPAGDKESAGAQALPAKTPASFGQALRNALARNGS